MKSLHTARPLLTDSQKSTAASLVEMLANQVATGVNETTLSNVRARLSEIEALELELVTNPFLRGRSAANLKVAKFLKP